MEINKTIFLVFVCLLISQTLIAQTPVSPETKREQKQVNTWLSGHQDVKILSQAEYDKLTTVELAEINALDEKIIYEGTLTLATIEQFEADRSVKSLSPQVEQTKIEEFLKNNPRLITMPRSDFNAKLPGQSAPDDIIVYDGDQLSWQDIENFVRRTH